MLMKTNQSIELNFIFWMTWIFDQVPTDNNSMFDDLTLGASNVIVAKIAGFIDDIFSLPILENGKTVPLPPTFPFSV